MTIQLRNLVPLVMISHEIYFILDLVHFDRYKIRRRKIKSLQKIQDLTDQLKLYCNKISSDGVNLFVSYIFMYFVPALRFKRKQKGYLI